MKTAEVLIVPAGNPNEVKEPNDIGGSTVATEGGTILGADLTEVSPPLDPSGRTAIVAANLLFEELCLVADAVSAARASGEATSSPSMLRRPSVRPLAKTPGESPPPPATGGGRGRGRRAVRRR